MNGDRAAASQRVRPWPVRAALSFIDLRRRPPSRDHGTVWEAVRAARKRDAPRVLSFVVVKRINPRFGDLGHWWIEVDDAESYGWWPRPARVRWHRFLVGTPGTLNASRGGIRYITDPHHRDPAEHSFHPTLVVRKSDRRVRHEIRKFARRYRAGWRWRARGATADCRRFQLLLFDAVGLAEDSSQLQTRGEGCPFLRLIGMRSGFQRCYDVGTLRVEQSTECG